jgi:hypothetical protein
MQISGGEGHSFNPSRSNGPEDADFLVTPSGHRRRRRALPEPGASLTVDDPAIREVMNTETGEHQPVEVVIGNDLSALHQLRMRVSTSMHQDQPLYRCSRCFVPVYICGHPKTARFFFRHREELGNCPAITRGSLSQTEINALKYNGAKESKLHLKMKDWVEACLKADGQFQDVEMEKAWKGQLTGEWRRPDVRATYHGIPVAFEVQLSTTFLDVIVERRLFYLQQGGLLFWIFAMFDNEHRRMTDEDVFYNNNQNAFIVNASTVESSLAEGRFMMECVWSTPNVDDVTSVLNRKVVGFDELTLEIQKQRAYYFDFDGRRQELASEKLNEAQVLREEFEVWWEVRFAQTYPQAEWTKFAKRLRKLGLPAPYAYRDIDVELITALYSAKHNRPYGQGKKRLVEVAHHLATAYKHHLTWFMHAVRHYGRLATMSAEGDPRKWAEKYKACRKEYLTNPESYAPARTSQALIEFLFPELMPMP